MIITDMIYKGIVTLKHYDRYHNLKSTLLLHNAGEKALFNLLYSTLTSGVIDYNDRPGKIMLASKSPEENPEAQLLNFIQLTGSVYGPSLETSNTNCARFTFYLPYSALSNSEGASLKDKYLYLYPLP